MSIRLYFKSTVLLAFVSFYSVLIHIEADQNDFMPPFLRKNIQSNSNTNNYFQSRNVPNRNKQQPGSIVPHTNLGVLRPEIVDKYHVPLQNASEKNSVPSITDINRAISFEHQQDQSRDSQMSVRTLDKPTVVAPAPAKARPRTRTRSHAGNPRSSTNRNRNSRQSVSEGHRLITRALWRIFDALMEKNENNAIQERMTFVENALKDLIAHNSKLEGSLEMVKEENLDLNERLSQLSGDLKRIAGKVEDLSEWRVSLLDAQNDGAAPHSFVALTTHRSCPLPFETVNGECFFLGGETKRSWADARKACANFGQTADLAAPKDIKTLQEFLNDLQYRPEYVWVGASIQGDGEWVWSAGPKESQRKVDMGRKTWNTDLPNNSGNCMGLYEGAGYRAYDYHCSELDFYVCQYFLTK